MPSKDRRPPPEIVGEFVRKAETVRNDVLVGIDPGSTGAIAFWCATFYCVVDIPVIITKARKTKRTTRKERRKTGKKTKVANCNLREFDLAGICGLFRLLKPVKHRVHVILEKIPPTLGRGRKYAEIMLNRAYAMWPLFLHSKGYASVTQERPGVWKAEFGLLGQDKEADRKLARKLFPKADILRIKDHDRSDALLLAEFLRRRRAAGRKRS